MVTVLVTSSMTATTAIKASRRKFKLPKSLGSGGQGTRTDDVSVSNANGLRDQSIASGTYSGTVDANSAPIGADLAAIIQRWPRLPEAVRVSILAMIEAVGKAT